MDKLNIICIDDQREVLNALADDLEEFEEKVNIEVTESADEAYDLISEIDTRGDYVALIIADHVMPGMTGVEFLTKVRQDHRFEKTRMILLTGLATHQDTITAINQAHIDFYLEKPWKRKQITHLVKILLTRFLLTKDLDYRKYPSLIDQETLLEELQKRPGL